jgi:hypothetical protein
VERRASGVVGEHRRDTVARRGRPTVEITWTGDDRKDPAALGAASLVVVGVAQQDRVACAQDACGTMNHDAENQPSHRA